MDMDKNLDKQLYKKQRKQERYIRNGLIATAGVLGVVALGLGAWVYKLKPNEYGAIEPSIQGAPHRHIPELLGFQPYSSL